MGKRRKNVSWTAPDSGSEITVAEADLQVQQDIRDGLLELMGLLRCHRLPRALDALISLGVAARRRKRRRK